MIMSAVMVVRGGSKRGGKSWGGSDDLRGRGKKKEERIHLNVQQPDRQMLKMVTKLQTQKYSRKTRKYPPGAIGSCDSTSNEKDK